MGQATHRTRITEPPRDVLVALLKDKRDLARLHEDKWYRIPVDTAPKHWPPKWLALYQGKGYGDESYAVNYYGDVRAIQTVRRRDLFPDEFPNPKSDRLYYKIVLQSVDKRDPPIRSTRPRRLVFVPTTWQKFSTAQAINDLFADSPAEDRLWDEFKRLKIDAERQWEVINNDVFYKLDFALFCKEGKIDVEVDGEWHHTHERAPQDNLRNNELESVGWHVLRFAAKTVRESMGEECIPKIEATINNLKGLSHEGLVSRKFYHLPGMDAEQHSLFEDSAEYDID